MRVDKAKKGMVVLDKITRAVYEIRDVIRENDKTVAVAAEVLESEETENPRVIRITEDTDITYSVVKWVKDTDIPDATVRDGDLYIGEKRIQTGKWDIRRIIRPVRGYVIMEAWDDNDPSRVNLISFQPSRDRFQLLANVKDSYSIIRSNQDEILFANIEISEKEEKDEDGNVVKHPVLEENQLLYFCDGQFTVANEDDPINLQDLKVYPEDDSEGTIQRIFVGHKSLDNLDAKESTSLYTVWSIAGMHELYFEKTVDLPTGNIKAVTSMLQSNGSWDDVIFGENYIKVNGYVFRGPEVEKLIAEKYFWVVGRFFDDPYKTYTFSTKDRQLHILTIKATNDRGYVYTLQ